MKEKRVIYQTGNSYSTLNQLTDQTENVWICCHGLGYLSRYFIAYFKALDPVKNYVIAPQAPSKYYQDREFKYVGASWLTKEDTVNETENVINYLDAIWEAEQIPSNKNIIIFGFSQGVSVSMRWMVRRKIKAEMLVIYAGGIPIELTKADFEFFKGQKVKVVYGKQDPYLTEEVQERHLKMLDNLFDKDQVEFYPFEGKHEVKPEVICGLIEK